MLYDCIDIIIMTRPWYILVTGEGLIRLGGGRYDISPHFTPLPRTYPGDKGVLHECYTLDFARNGKCLTVGALNLDKSR